MDRLTISLKNDWLLLTGFILFCHAQAAMAVEILPPVTVYAPRSSLSNVINQPEILEEKDLTVAHERTIIDVAQGLPGINATKLSGFGQPNAFYIHGVGGQGVVTLDGIPLLQSIPGFFNLDALPVESMQSAKIVRGPDSAYQAFQSLGGGIHLTTQDRQETGGRLSVEGGSYGLLRETLQTGIKGSLGRATTTLSRTDAFDGMHVANAKTNPERDSTHFTQGLLRFSSDLNSRMSWESSMLYRKSGSSIDNYGTDNQGLVTGKDDLNGHAREETWLAQSGLKAKMTDAWSSHLQLGYTQLATHIQLTGLENDVFTHLYLANWHNQHTLIDNPQRGLQWQINWGAQGRHEQGISTTSQFVQRRTQIASFLQTQAQIGSVSGEAGIRVEQFDQYGNHPLFKTAAAWRMTPAITFRASGGTGFRLPSYTELLFLFFSNRNLQPERSASGDLGLEWQANKNLQLTLHGFYHRYDDLIATAHDPFFGPITLNVPDATVAGTELSGQYDWTRQLRTGISYTYSDSRNLQTDKALPFRPYHIARLWEEYKFQQLPVTLWAETIIRSSTWNDFRNTLPVKGSVQLNAAIRYAVLNNVEMYLRGENLTNNQTPQMYGFNAQGVAVYGGFKLDC